MSAPKFKIGDHVKWRRVDGPSSVGDVVAMKVDAAYGYQYRLSDGSGLWWHESHLLLDVPEPKKYATDLEARLGAEIINLHRAVTDLSNRLSEEIGGRHRERIAKEAAQKELAEAQEAQRAVNDAYAAAVGKLYEAQKMNSKLMTKLDNITRIAETP